MTGVLDRPRLVELEEVIDRGLAAFVEVGQALLEIRDSRLYLESHATFEDYCRERWGRGRRWAYQLIEAAEVCAVAHIEPVNEAQARELAPLRDEVELMAEAWQVATSNGPPTAAKVREAVLLVRPPANVNEHTDCPTCGRRLRKDQPLSPSMLRRALRAAGELAEGVVEVEDVVPDHDHRPDRHLVDEQANSPAPKPRRPPTHSLDTARGRQVAHANKRRIEELVGTCQAIATATDDLHTELAAGVSSREEAEGWAQVFHEAQKALGRMRSRLNGGGST